MPDQNVLAGQLRVPQLRNAQALDSPSRFSARRGGGLDRYGPNQADLRRGHKRAHAAVGSERINAMSIDEAERQSKMRIDPDLRHRPGTRWMRARRPRGHKAEPLSLDFV